MAFAPATVLTNVGKSIITGRLIGNGSEPKYVAIGTGATAAARTALATDSSLSVPAESRVGTNSGTQVTTTTTNDTYQVVQTITATASRAVDESALFDASSGGNMAMSATFAVINLSTGDSLQLTNKLVVS